MVNLSCTMIRATRATGAHFLGRLPTTVKPLHLHTLADGTQLVALRPGDYRERRQGALVVVRLVRYTLDHPPRPGHGTEHRLIASLLNPRVASAEELVMAYHRRWEFELAADELKTHQRPSTPLHSEKPVGVIQQIYSLLLAHYAVCTVMLDAAQARDLDPMLLSFPTTLRLLRVALPDFQRAAPVEHPQLYRQLLADMAAAHLPARDNRSNPRVVKQKMSSFKVKGPHHQHSPQPSKPFRTAIVLLI